jgi:amino acid adenylation domain-containing protein/non-ribosomal peptide synthase protein (TIGR01720 family)/FkbM family methyltransferase
MSISKLISKLKKLDIKIQLNSADQLKILAPKGKLEAGLLDEIKIRKQEIIDFLKVIPDSSFINIKKVQKSEFYEISHAQKRLWLLDQLLEEKQAYNMPVSYILKGDLKEETLSKVLDTIVNRHESLRTVIVTDNGLPKQKINSLKHSGFKLKCTDLRDEDNKEELAHKLAVLEAGTPFNLAQGPLIRAQLLRLEDKRHIFLITLHHIISDGWSISVLFNEIITLYHAFSSGRKNPLSPLKIQHKDFAAWQNEQLNEDAIMEHRSYWCNQFKDEISIIEVPADYIRPNVKTFSGAYETVLLNEVISQKLQQLSRKYNATLFMILLSSVKALLYKYSGQTDITVGTPVAGRENEDLENQIGFYINTLALRTRLDETGNFKQLLESVKQTALAAYEHQLFPFDRLIEDLNLTRDLSRSPLFDIMVILQNAQDIAAPQKAMEGIEVSGYNLDSNISKYDLTFNFNETGNQIAVSIEYNTNLYSKSTIQLLVQHYKQLLDIIVEDSDVSLNRLQYLSALERHTLLIDFNNTAQDYNNSKTIHQLIEEQVEKNPDAIAVINNEEKFTYAQLNAKANQIAHYLREHQYVKPNDRVGIMIGRSEKMIIGILAILKSGGTYVPIDPEYPADRIQYILQDSNVELLLTEQHLQIDVAEFVSLIYLDEAIRFNQDKNPLLVNLPSDSSYIIYTSGSTGQPKGIEVAHQNTVSFINWAKQEFGASDYHIVYAGTSYCFDLSVFEILFTLSAGKTIRVLSSGMQAQEYLATDRKILINTVPSVIEAFLAEGVDFKNVTVLNLAGEPVPYAIRKKLDYHAIEIRNLYGPSEDTTYSSCYKFCDDHTIIPIGKPVANTKFYILDKDLNLQPQGIMGEICISGDGLAKGYLNLPELTNEKFVENPFEKGTRLYHTGDFGRWMPDGNIEFFGRKDSQVKIRGYRIELGEIENILRKHESIEKAVVLVNEDKNKVQHIIAYYTNKAGEENNVDSLRNFLIQYLPAYMMPSFLIPLAEFPLNFNGKIDHKALPHPQDFYINNNYQAARNEVEHALVSIWEEVLRSKPIGIRDNFFQVGGDSIKALQMASRMYKLGFKIDVKDIFKKPSIEELSFHIKELKRLTAQDIVTGEVLLTPIQKDFFTIQRKHPHHCNQSVMLFSNSGFESNCIRAVFTKFQEHHDSLRMSYKFGSWPVLQINNSLEYPLSFQEFDFKDLNNQMEMLLEKATDLQSNINLETGPLMKIGLFHLDDGDRLLVVIHHLVVDRVSWQILFEDIERLINQYKENTPLTLPLKTDSFKVWAQTLQQYSNSIEFLKEKSYWENLEKIPVTPLPVKNDGNRFLKGRNQVSFVLSKQETQSLLTKANQAFNTDINDILLTALGLGVKEVTQLTKVLIALEGNGRAEITKGININRTVGCFTSVYPVILDVSFQDMGRQIKEIKEHLHKVPNRGIGYGILKYLTYEENKTDLKFKLSPQLCFNYLGQFDADLSDRSFTDVTESMGPSMSLDNESRYELDISGMITEGSLGITIQYSKEQYNQSFIENLCQAFKYNLLLVINYCASQSAHQYTPTDFSYKNLSIEKLEALNNLYKIEDIYPLAPTQEGMLFHALLDGSSSYFEQMSYRLHGEMDVKLVQKSLKSLFKRHGILRTAFIHEGLDCPLQVVIKDRDEDFYYKDLCDIESVTERLAFVKAFKEESKTNPPDLSRDTLMKVCVLRLNEAEYEFIWSFHHILMDGWCMGILALEFHNTYNSLNNNTIYKLPPVKHYRSYIEWLQKQDKSLSINYWIKYLEDYEKASGIPRKRLNFNLEPNQYVKGEEVFEIDKNRTALLKKLSTEKHITLNTLLQTIWGVLLAKYNDTRDVVYGVIVSGRPPEVEGIESMVGLFINTIPVRIKYQEGMTFPQLFDIVQEEAIESVPHHYSPLVETQSANLLKQNLFDHVLAFENFPVAEQVEGYNHQSINNNSISLTVSSINTDAHTSFEFNVIIEPGDSLRVKFHYNEILYDDLIVSKIAEHFTQIIDHILNKKDVAIDSLSLISEEDRYQLSEVFNDTQRDYFHQKNIHTLFEEQAKKTPDNIALIFEDITLTYNQLNEQANRLAHFLRNTFNLKPDDLVALMVERSERMIISILGILKAGAAYVPVDPDYPKEKIEYILADVDAKLLVTDSQFMFHLEKYQGPLFALDIQLAGLEDNIHNPVNINTPSDLAYVIYTSGTTGKPKGVMIEHTGNVNMASDQISRFGVTEKDHVLQFASLSFDASVYEIFMALYAGASLVLVSQSTIKDPGRFVDYIKNQKVSIVTLPPVYLAVLPLSQLSFLRVIITAGEAPNITDATECSLFCDYYNAYGPTECAVCITTYKVTPDDKHKQSLPLGKPISNIQIHLLDENEMLVPIGTEGEICVSGVGVARGYLNKPELTNEKFIHQSGKRLYKTGDKGKWMKDGNLEFFGRKDDQLKIRGYRIEPGEIENSLKQHSGIENASVYATQNLDHGKTLVAAIVPAGDTAFTLKQLMKFNEDTSVVRKFVDLPNGMVVSHRNNGETDLIYKEIFERNIYLQNGIDINEGDVIVDVGANIGLFSLFAALYASNTKVFAFEPIGSVFNTLKDNIALYDVDITAFNVGLSNKEETAQFFFYPHNTAISGKYAGGVDEEETVKAYIQKQSESLDEQVSAEDMNSILADRMQPELVECKVKRLSDILAELNLEKIDLIKIDVEKSELDVIEGIDDNDWAKIRQIVIEAHDIEDHIDRIKNLLNDKGFEIFSDQQEVLEKTHILNIYGVRSGYTSAKQLKKQSLIFNQKHNWTNFEAYINDIRESCKRNLPDYMIPSVYKLVKEIPVTIQGKVNKKILETLDDLSLLGIQSTITLPGNDTEERLCRIWKEILEKERISVNDDFFEIGGHSLKATQLASRIYIEFNVKLELSSIFNTPTIEGIARIINSSEYVKYEEIESGEVQPYYELSHAQKRLWLLEQTEKGNVAYNMPSVYELNGSLDIPALEKAFNTLIERHYSLRTVFVTVNGEVKQKVNDVKLSENILEYIDLRTLNNQAVVTDRYVKQEVNIPFDLEAGPLIRTKLLHLDDEHFIFLFTMHHIIADGWSMSVMTNEIFTLYNAYKEGKPNPLQPLRIQYTDFSTWQNKQLDDEKIKKYQSYWWEQFNGAIPVLEMPTDYERPSLKTYNGDTISFMLNEALSRQLITMNQRYGVSLFMTLLASIKILLYKYSGQNDIIVGTPIAGREHPDLENQIGFYLNTLAIRTRINGSMRYRDYLDKVKSTTLDAYKYQLYPFDRLIDDLNLDMDRSRSPLFDVMLVLQNSEFKEKSIEDIQGIRISTYNQDIGLTSSKFDLTFTFKELNKNIFGSINFNTNLFKTESIENMRNDFLKLLSIVAENDEIIISDIELLSDTEKEKFDSFVN